MSDQELIGRLQELIAQKSSTTGSRQLAGEIIARDRWRVRLLAGFTALLWLAGIAGILYAVFWFNRFIIAYAPANAETGSAWLTSEQFHTKMELHHSLELSRWAVGALLLAALSTIWLVLSSRRATLTQINISLAQISEQIRGLRQLPQRPAE